AEAWMFAADGDSMQLAYNQQGLQILLDKGAIAEGQSAQILVMSDASDRHVLFTVEAETLMSIEVLHLKGNMKLVSIPLDVTHVPNVYLTASEVRNGKLREAQEKLIVPPARHFLDLDVTLDAESYRPGSKGTFEVQVRDSSGEPVRSEVSLSLFDGSLLGIAEDMIPDPRKFFWGHNRRQRVVGSSCFNQFSYIRLVENEGGQLMTPGDLLRYKQDGSQPIFDIRHTGEVIMGRQELSSTESGPMPPGASGPSSPGPSFAARSKSKKAGAPAARLSEDAFRDSTTRSLVGLQGESEGGMEPSEGPTGTITVRADFRETALWLPTIVTDEKGQARGEFTLPDSTTRWQISSFANDGSDSFGSDRKQGAVTELPMILRPQMPRFLVENDEARISALVTNTTDAAIEAQVSFKAQGLKILGFFDGDQLRPGNKAPLSVPAHGEGRLDFQVRPTELGKASLTLTAVSSEASDAVQRSLPIIEHGIEALVSDSGRLTDATLEHTFLLPPAKDGRTQMQISVAPSLA
ncbi:MAG: hypothetical protein GY930_17640, partial [bacterium]|nr:hypothetical protein [bacterium]